MRFVVIAAALVLLTACGRFAPGFIITNDGRTLSNNDENNRQLAVDSIRTQLDAQLGGHWRTAVSLPELPVYASEESHFQTQGGWLWAKATATVVLVGDGSAPLPMTTDSIRDAVLEYLRPKVERPDHNLTVTVTSTVDAARFASLGVPDVAAAPKTITVTGAAGAAPTRRYTVQTGDTLADISAVFYGSSQHWRLIREANPGIDVGELKAGTVLTMPPKP